ncbi:MAG TPA: hypothetical protein VJ386_08885, partial [Candidatus Deferrimicrobiaceae bacterium]|nr:hypothetical protein [Candidatus Deferrimicrobiaceae bacterium]
MPRGCVLCRCARLWGAGGESGSRDYFLGEAGVPCGAGGGEAVPPGAAGLACGIGGIAGWPIGPGIVCTGAAPFMMLEAGLLPEKYARKRDVIMKTTAAAAVSLLRKLVGPLDPN